MMSKEEHIKESEKIYIGIGFSKYTAHKKAIKDWEQYKKLIKKHTKEEKKILGNRN